MKTGKMIFYTTLSVMFLLAFGWLAEPGTAQAAMSKAEQHKLYQATIKNYDKAVRKQAKKVGMEGENTYYLFVDIDKNGIDECVLRYGGSANTAESSGYGENTSIYTIKKNKVTAVIKNHESFNPGEHRDYVRIYKNRSKIDLGFSHGDGDYYFCQYKNGKIKKKGSISITFYTNQSGKNVASINEKKIVSVAAGRKKYNKLSNHGKGYQMKQYQG